MLVEIRCTVICHHHSGMKPKEIAMRVNLLSWTVVGLIKKWEDTGFITHKKKCLYDLKS